jgi:hypothetical protein
MVHFLAGVMDFSLHHPEWLWGPTTPCPEGTRGPLPGSKAAGE